VVEGSGYKVFRFRLLLFRALWCSGSGFTVEGLGFRVWGASFRVQGLGFRV
jgi:hypothetical protein